MSQPWSTHLVGMVSATFSAGGIFLVHGEMGHPIMKNFLFQENNIVLKMNRAFSLSISLVANPYT